MRTHPVNVTHLVFGLIFLGLAGAWGLRQLDVIEVDGLRWTVPLVLFVAGAAGLVASLAKSLSRRREPTALPDLDDERPAPGDGS